MNDDLIAKVSLFLKENGYPDDSVVFEYTISNLDGRIRYRADIAIVDSEQMLPLAIFEIKRKPVSKQVLANIIRQINSCVSRYRSHIRVYLVFEANNKLGFTIHEVSVDKIIDSAEITYYDQRDELPRIVSYTSLIKTSNAERQRANVEEKEQRHDALVRWRWCGILVLVGIFIRDYYRNNWGLSWECLSVCLYCVVRLFCGYCRILI